MVPAQNTKNKYKDPISFMVTRKKLSFKSRKKLKRSKKVEFKKNLNWFLKSINKTKKNFEKVYFLTVENVFNYLKSRV